MDFFVFFSKCIIFAPAMKNNRCIAWMLLVVSIVMLTASVLPHHHHQHILCLHNDVEACECSCETAGNHETTHHESCKEHCITNFVSVTPEVTQADICDDDFIFYPLYFLTDILSIPLPISISIEHNVPSSKEKLYAACIKHVMGLRAPPCC